MTLKRPRWPKWSRQSTPVRRSGAPPSAEAHPANLAHRGPQLLLPPVGRHDRSADPAVCTPRGWSTDDRGPRTWPAQARCAHNRRRRNLPCCWRMAAYMACAPPLETSFTAGAVLIAGGAWSTSFSRQLDVQIPVCAAARADHPSRCSRSGKRRLVDRDGFQRPLSGALAGRSRRGRRDAGDWQRIFCLRNG